MFICEDCHNGTTCSLCGGPDNHYDFKASFGRCEVCGESKGCAECFHHHRCPEIQRRIEASP